MYSGRASKTVEILQGILHDGVWIKKVPSCYTPSQVLQWLSTIGYEHHLSEAALLTGSFPTSLANLEDLVQLHLRTFPFENTAMHYTAEHTMDVTPEGAFNRLVTERKGSYCFGLNAVFLNMLRGLGYRAYAVAARVNKPDASAAVKYTSLTHMVTLVQPFEHSNETHLVDVGFGSPGLARPILLSNAEGSFVFGINLTEVHRLTRSALPTSSLDLCPVEAFQNSSVPGELKWNLEVRQEKNEDLAASPWRILYTFSEEEFYPKDATDASYIVCNNYEPGGLFCNHVVCVKYFLLDKDDPALMYRRKSVEGAGLYMYRMVLMGNEVKKDVGGSSQVVRTLTTELDRIKALREIFNVNVQDEDAVHIRGRVPALAS